MDLVLKNLLDLALCGNVSVPFQWIKPVTELKELTESSNGMILYASSGQCDLPENRKAYR